PRGRAGLAVRVQAEAYRLCAPPRAVGASDRVAAAVDADAAAAVVLRGGGALRVLHRLRRRTAARVELTIFRTVVRDLPRAALARDLVRQHEAPFARHR